MKQVHLSRVISRFGVAALALNGIVGAGIFVLPAAAEELSGSFSPWMFIICGLFMSIIVLSFAQLAAAFSQTGGPVLYTQQAFGHHVAFQTTWLLYIGRLTAVAANASALIAYIDYLMSQYDVLIFNQSIYAHLLLITCLFLLMIANLFGVRKTMGVINIITVLKLAPLIVFIFVGLSYWDNTQVFAFDLAQLTDFDGAILLLLYAYIGFEGALIPAGESVKPKKNIAKALIATLALTMLLYFLIQSIAISVQPNLSESKTPLADVAMILLGTSGALMITVAAIVSITGNLSSAIFTAPRMTYALAELGSLPHWFGQLDKSTQVPRNSIIFLVVIAGLLAISGSFVWLAVISSLARLFGYFISILSLIKLRKKLIDNGHWFLPFGLLIPLTALIICFWLSMHASVQSWLMTLLFTLVGSCLFLLSKKTNIDDN